MIEIWSRELNQGRFLNAVNALMQAPGFREDKDDESIIHFVWPELRGLDGYRLSPGSNVELKYQTSDSRSLSTLSEIASGLQPFARTTGASLLLEIAESGVAYDPDDAMDLNYLFHASSRGLVVSAYIGNASRGSRTITERLDVFKAVVSALGLDADLSVALTGGKLSLNALGGRITVPVEPGRKWPHPPCAVQQGSEAGGVNFTGLLVLGVFSSGELGPLVRQVTSHYRQGAILRIRLRVVCTESEYGAVRGELATKGLAPWDVQMTLTNPFKLSELESALRDIGDFNFRAFSFRIKKFGAVDVDLSREGERYRMRFVPESSVPAVEMGLSAALEGLKGVGSEFLDTEG